VRRGLPAGGSRQLHVVRRRSSAGSAPHLHSGRAGPSGVSATGGLALLHFIIKVSDTYAGPGELDIMAEMTGFRLIVCTSADWSGGSFMAASNKHVSVYELVRSS
jgi:hypothetical protein